MGLMTGLLTIPNAVSGAKKVANTAERFVSGKNTWENKQNKKMGVDSQTKPSQSPNTQGYWQQQQKKLQQNQQNAIKEKQKLNNFAQKKTTQLNKPKNNLLPSPAKTSLQAPNKINVDSLVKQAQAKNKLAVQRGLALPLATPNAKLQSAALRKNQQNVVRKQKAFNKLQSKPRNVGGLPFNNPNSLQKPKMNVNTLMNQPHKNTKPSKKLSNSVSNSYEDKIKKIMGVD